MKYMRVVSFILFIFIFSTLGCAQSSSDSCSSFVKAYKEFKNGTGSKDTMEFIKRSRTILDGSNVCLDAYLTRADLLLTIDSLESAKIDYQTILNYDSTNVYAHYQLGFLFYLKEDYDLAIFHFQRALDLKKVGNMIVDYSEGGRELGTKKSKYDIESNEIIYRLGQSSYFKRDLNNAFVYFDYCIKNSYLLDKCFLYRGAVLLESKRKDHDPCKDFSEALKHGNMDAKLYLEKYCSGK